MIGKNLLDTSSDASTNKDDGDDDGILGSIKDKWNKAKDKVKGEINEITGDVADELADRLGVSEWYSIHVMSTCDGDFKPNATSPGAGFNVTNCTNSAPESESTHTKM